MTSVAAIFLLRVQPPSGRRTIQLSVELRKFVFGVSALELMREFRVFRVIGHASQEPELFPDRLLLALGTPGAVDPF